ncbi:hypothetical protein HK098_008193 [Nowakowskiella sp. JEL0407]|nr:hypothetical protein HK098_008193 [Nowakowskiella sp. JEL0407]
MASSPFKRPPRKVGSTSSADLLKDKGNPNAVIESLRQIYKNKIRPLEQTYQFESFHSSPLTDSDIAAKPMVLLLGQYSVGKTSFIKYILEKEYPGAHIDRFVAIMHGEDERAIPGNAAAVSADLPFTALTKFGTAFLGKFQVSQLNSPVLENVTFIDTPGVLSGEKQSIGRAYDFPAVVEWYAERSDLILLLFDAHKLDISDEFKRTITALHGHDDKIRVVLNKADMVSSQQLMRVYGALMWALGKVFHAPEVVRVYIGSFWDQPLQNKESEALLRAEQQDLLNDLKSLPRNAMIRKINEIVKRTRMAKVHALIISHLKSEMPSIWGKSSKQNELIEGLENEFIKIARQHKLARGDFPVPEKFKELLAEFKIDKFPKLDKKLLANVDEALTVDLPNLMQDFPQTAKAVPAVARNPFEEMGQSSPDGSRTGPPADRVWTYEYVDRSAYIKKFNECGPIEGKLSGAQLKPIMEATGFDTTLLAKIWRISDWTKDGYLDADEFVVAMWMCDVKKNGWAEIPDELPAGLVVHRKI